MTIRITGMNSGLDTESIIRELTKVEKDKVTKVKNEQKRLEMKQDKWKDLNKKVVSFYNKSLSNMRFDGSYVKKSTSLSNDKVASVSTNGTAMNGTQKMEVKALASSAYMTGGKVSTKGAKRSTGALTYTDAEGKTQTATGSTKLTDMGFKVGDEISISIGGKSYSRKIENENWTLENLPTRLAVAKDGEGNTIPSGTTFSFDAEKGLSVNNPDAGISIIDAGWLDGSAPVATDYQGMTSEQIDDAGFGALTETDETNVDGYRLFLDESGNSWYKVTDDGGNETYNMYQTANDRRQTELTKIIQLDEVDNETAKNDTTMKELGISGNSKLRLNFGSSGKEFADIEIKETDTINDVVSKLKNAASQSGYKVNANYDEKQGRFYISSSETGADKGFSIDHADSDPMLVRALSLDDRFGDGDKKAVFNAGTDAEIELNGVTYKSDSSKFDINGLTINVKELGTTQITTSDDNSGVYDMIKSFISEYNDLIKEISTLYNGDRNKDFDFLTADQKEEMTDDEIADWNKKIDESIMSHDDTLGKIMRNMKNIMLSSFDLGAKDDKGNPIKTSLSTFGIGSLAYGQAEKNERAMLHIDGDEDDEYTSSKDDKLRAAISENPKLVADYFKELSKKLYSSLGDMMKSTDFSSSFTLYEDKLMKKNYDDYKTKIKKAEDLLASREDAYYKQYAKLEKAMGEMNSQQSALGGIMG